ncbi:hypothetical protein FB465_2565 [Kitasatospora atroaurantiaca]|uniref:Uncharacterized protein n=1 Tax=Kitasatospora atroaurantiaca TaxID=285545 RepID=A0A561EPJ5_9ACTN|nr:hypothetical protein FB465_2565 [Kitasatospora atroaurantiaca]
MTATAWAFFSSVTAVFVSSSSTPTEDFAVSVTASPTLSQKPGSSGMSRLAWSMASDIICIVMAASFA